MKDYKNFTKILTCLLCLSVVLYSCSDDALESVESVQIESVASDVSSNCDNPPSDDSDFYDALDQSKLQSDYLSSDQKDLIDWCRSGVFYLNGTWMVLVNDDGLKDRTEIRQEKNLTLGDYNRMYFKAKVSDIPGGNGLTIAQIHNDGGGSGVVDRPLVKLIIEGGEIQAIVNSTYGDNNNDTDVRHTFTTYSEGTNIIVDIKMQTDGEVDIRVKKGSTNYNWSFDPESDWDDSDVRNEFYFKTGVYAQTSGEKSEISYKWLKFYD